MSYPNTIQANVSTRLTKGRKTCNEQQKKVATIRLYCKRFAYLIRLPDPYSKNFHLLLIKKGFLI